MHNLKKIIYIFIFLMIASTSYAALKIVAAENFYGLAAKQLGGSNVEVTSILNNPNQDPHLFSATPGTARIIANADIIVYNGAHYDDWMQSLINAAGKQVQIINIAALMHIPKGANPHLWYNPVTMQAYAEKLIALLKTLEPQNAAFYEQKHQQFIKELIVLSEKITQLKKGLNGKSILATEPVFNYMAQQLDLNIQGQALQQSIMNDTPPTPRQVQEFETIIKSHQVPVLIYNKQVQNDLTQHLQQLAKDNHMQLVGITETQPPDKTYVQWMLEQLADLEKAFANAK